MCRIEQFRSPQSHSIANSSFLTLSYATSCGSVEHQTLPIPKPLLLTYKSISNSICYFSIPASFCEPNRSYSLPPTFPQTKPTSLLTFSFQGLSLFASRSPFRPHFPPPVQLPRHPITPLLEALLDPAKMLLDIKSGPSITH